MLVKTCSPFMGISTHLDVYEPSEEYYRLFINSMAYVFVSLRPPYLCPLEGHKHGVSVQSLINLSKTFFEYVTHETSHRREPLRDCLNIHLLVSL